MNMISSDNNNNNNGNGSRNKYNETKYRILAFLKKSYCELSPLDIADGAGTTLQGAKERLRLLNKMGYIWRKMETRKGKRNYYSYSNLKPKGERVFEQLDERIKIREVTGIQISLNLNKPIPEVARIEYNRMLNVGGYSE